MSSKYVGEALALARPLQSHFVVDGHIAASHREIADGVITFVHPAPGLPRPAEMSMT
jgi:hypothetical protein